MDGPARVQFFYKSLTACGIFVREYVAGGPLQAYGNARKVGNDISPGARTGLGTVNWFPTTDQRIVTDPSDCFALQAILAEALEPYDPRAREQVVGDLWAARHVPRGAGPYIIIFQLPSSDVQASVR